jgi:hypothetical protein
MMGLTVISTASMGEILAAIQDLAPALLATLGFTVVIVKSFNMWSI